MITLDFHSLACCIIYKIPFALLESSCQSRITICSIIITQPQCSRAPFFSPFFSPFSLQSSSLSISPVSSPFSNPASTHPRARLQSRSRPRYQNNLLPPNSSCSLNFPPNYNVEYGISLARKSGSLKLVVCSPFRYF